MNSLGGNDVWRGVFLPLVKHDNHPDREEPHPEHFPDHVIIGDLTMLDDDEIEAYDEDFENDYGFDQLTQLGDGPVPYLARVRFAGDTDGKYDFVVHLSQTDDEESLKEEAKELVLGDLTS